MLAKSNARVAVNFTHNGAALRHVVSSIREAGGEAMEMQADVRNPDDVRQLAEAVVDRWGRLDILVNNAGMSIAMKPIADMTWDEFAQKLNDEMKAAFVLTQAVTGVMKTPKYGRLLYVASGLVKRLPPRWQRMAAPRRF